MTSTAITLRNPHLDIDCPHWCTADHGAGIKACVSQPDSISFGDRDLDSMWASALLSAHHDGRPVVSITSHYYGRPGAPYIEVPPLNADQLAGLVEMLAAATPEQHHKLAAAIRQSAAAITEADHG